MSTVVGIAYGHTATVAVVSGGRLVFCQSEERLNRLKGSTGFPQRTLGHVYETICAPDDIEQAVLFQESRTGYVHLKSKAFKAHQVGGLLAPSDLPSAADVEPYLRDPGIAERWATADRTYFSAMDQDPALLDEASKYFCAAAGVPASKLTAIDHHRAHALSCVPFLHDDTRPTLIFTLDAEGDGICATVSVFVEGKLKRLAETPRVNSLGNIYSRTTGLLGMRSPEHEYKTMGLAGYAKREQCSELSESLKRLLWVSDEGTWENSYGAPIVLDFQLKNLFELKRFDNIAGAVQLYTEEMIAKWVRTWIVRTRVRDVACAGGVFMNVKANKEVLALQNVNSLVVTPSCGDESTAIGAAVYGALSCGDTVEPATSLALGREWSDREAEAVFEQAGVRERYLVSRPPLVNQAVADLLARGEVVARFAGRMEFGARALGNRSILADPRSPAVVEFINNAIKNRDFWMPFAPSILEDHSPSYLVNPKGASSPFMMLAFDTTARGRRDLAAAMHRSDFTVRAQLVSSTYHPSYYDLIERFGRLTGVYAVLNTSFNIHGEPIVGSPEDAISTMDRSGLRHCALGGFLIQKRIRASSI